MSITKKSRAAQVQNLHDFSLNKRLEEENENPYIYRFLMGKKNLKNVEP